MPSPKNLRIISKVSNISNHSTSTIFSITFSSTTKRFRVSKIFYKTHFLYFFIFLNIIYIAARFLYNVFINGTLKPVRLVLNSFVLFTTIIRMSYTFGFYKNASDFCCLLNCVMKYHTGFVRQTSSNFARKENLLLFLR